MSRLCNGVQDCADGSDEGPHCRGEGCSPLLSRGVPWVGLEACRLGAVCTLPLSCSGDAALCPGASPAVGAHTGHSSPQCPTCETGALH